MGGKGRAGRDGSESRDAGEAGDRLQKILARCGVGSRRANEELIRQGRVTVNGEVAKLGARAVLGRDRIKVDDRRIKAPAETRTLLLNKPRGCVTTRSDPQGRKTVMDFIPPRLRKGLFPVGRLDYDTEGLLLLTTDGDLADRVAHPRHGCTKIYEVKVKGRPDDDSLQRLRKGLHLHGRRLAPCEVRALKPRGPRGELRTNSWWTVKLNEGRTRQIREMFQRLGHPVNRLRRVAIGPLRDGKLAPGDCRPLSEDELRRLARALK
jgi:23S rRNA pseudouridine2605 synthase